MKERDVAGNAARTGRISNVTGHVTLSYRLADIVASDRTRRRRLAWRRVRCCFGGS